MIACNEIISVRDIVLTKMTNTIGTNVSINSDGKKVRYKNDCYILHTVLLLLIITIWYHYGKDRWKQKDINALTIKNGKEVSTKNGTCYNFDNAIKLEDCDIDNILIDE